MVLQSERKHSEASHNKLTHVMSIAVSLAPAFLLDTRCFLLKNGKSSSNHFFHEDAKKIVENM